MGDVLTLPLPFARNSDTSRDAADSMRGHAADVRARVFDYIAACGLDGATADEVLVALRLSHQTGSARVSELARDGVIVDSLMRRRTRSGRAAVVYKPSPSGTPEGARPSRPSRVVIGTALAELKALLAGREPGAALRAVSEWLVSEVRR